MKDVVIWSKRTSNFDNLAYNRDLAIYNAFDDDEEEEKNNNFYLDDVFDDLFMCIDFFLQYSPNNCKNKSDSSSSTNDSSLAEIIEEQKEWLKN